jgi:N-acetylglucosaminyldiphosphoundecaprenol N-acetyl-beta-D-mannosaminyltransferase
MVVTQVFAASARGSPARGGISSAGIPIFDVLGIPVVATSLETVAATVHRWAADSSGRMIFARDTPSAVLAAEDAAFHALHHQAAMVLPDGMPLVWVGRSRGFPAERVCGPDLMDRMMQETARTGLRHFLLGGKSGIAERLKGRFEQRYPGVAIAGIRTPPFGEIDETEIAATVEDIERSGADVVWVGISSPRQEWLMSRLIDRSSCTFIGVGAAFDFHAGAVRRAPRWMQRIGLEWLHRLKSEPRRLWRRYLVLAPRFVWLLATHRPQARWILRH